MENTQNSRHYLIQLINTTITVSDAAGISRPPYLFRGWNTAADGNGSDYEPGDTFTFTANTKLYAVWIEIHVSGLSLSSHSQTLNVGESVTIIAAVTPGDATYPTVTWTSTDDTVATVDNNGKVTATGIGSVTIMATADGKTDACTVIVSPSHLTSVSLSKHSQTLNVGQDVTLTATVTPSDSIYPTVTWTSTDEAVATVDQNGKVTAVGIGAATIIAKADGEFDICTVLVKAGTPVPESSAKPAGLEDMPIMLPKGAAAIQLPNGEIISNKDMDGTVKLQINIGDLNEDGELEFIALDSEGIPIGAFAIKFFDETEQVLTLDAADGVNNIFNTVLWIVIGVAGACAAAAIIYIVLRKRNQGSGNSF